MRKRSILETRFLTIWGRIDGPELVEELKFHPKRKWRYDFAHPATMVAIEIEGGIWDQSRHTRPIGFIKDCEKYNAGTNLGWHIFRLPGVLITSDSLEEIKNTICHRNTQNTAPPN
jgi:very-short-patch-repair endonuclease